MSVVLIVTQNLLDVDNFGACIPCDTSAHQIPIFTFFGGHPFQRGESRNGHQYRTAILQINLKLSIDHGTVL